MQFETFWESRHSTYANSEKKKTTHFRCCYRLNRVPQNVYVEALNSNVTALGNRAFKGMVKVK